MGREGQTGTDKPSTGALRGLSVHPYCPGCGSAMALSLRCRCRLLVLALLLATLSALVQPGARASPVAAVAANSSDESSGATTSDCDNDDSDLFPGNFFSVETLRGGAVVVNFIFAFYGFCTIALVCENFFLPSVQVICEELGLPPDVAAATFMSMATSAPELFVNIVSIFMTESTMGVGTTVGSATFNVLGIASFTGLASIHPIQLNWTPVLRDSLLYGMALGVTTAVVWDDSVEWYEALVMVLCSLAYLAFMFTHRNLARWVRHLLRSNSAIILTSAESEVATMDGVASPEKPIQTAVMKQVEAVSEKRESGRAVRALWWLWRLLSRPVSLLLRLTIPDCRKAHLRRFFFATFLLCVVWIAVAAYIVTWMISVIGDTFSIPDSVMGITLLAAGGSMPEAISGVIMARKGVGSMGISNGLGANTLNILMNLGMPWLVRSLMGKTTRSVLSDGLPFDFLALILSVLALNVILLLARYRLTTVQGTVTLFVYVTFLAIMVLNELDVFQLYTKSQCSR